LDCTGCSGSHMANFRKKSFPGKHLFTILMSFRVPDRATWVTFGPKSGQVRSVKSTCLKDLREPAEPSATQRNPAQPRPELSQTGPKNYQTD
jgi:hypothetical protein